MRIKGLHLTTWLKHPKMCWESLGRRKLPVVNLDKELQNCEVCGYDRDYISKDNKKHYCYQCNEYLRLKIQLDKCKNER